jgi:hypothetical protein
MAISALPAVCSAASACRQDAGGPRGYGRLSNVRDVSRIERVVKEDTMLTIVLFVFALHVVAWLTLPATRRAGEQKQIGYSLQAAAAE